MKGQIIATFADGTKYKVPLEVVFDDLVKEEMAESQIDYSIAQETVLSRLRNEDISLARHSNQMEWAELSSHLVLLSQTPTRMKKKFGWKNAKKEVIHEQ